MAKTLNEVLATARKSLPTPDGSRELLVQTLEHLKDTNDKFADLDLDALKQFTLVNSLIEVDTNIDMCGGDITNVGRLNADNVPNIYFIESGFQVDLPLSIRPGDIIYDRNTLTTGIAVNNDGGELYIYAINLDEDIITEYYYNADTENNTWDYISREEHTIGGTKLYRHSLGVPVSISGQSFTINIKAILNDNTKITNPGMLSMLNNAVSVKMSAYLEGTDLFPQFINFASGPNLLEMWLTRGKSSVTEGYQSPQITSISAEDTVTPL